MQKHLQKLLLIVAMMFVPWVTQAQDAFSYSCNFDSDSDTAGWVLVNGSQQNKWFIGTAAHNSGTKSLYISNNNGTSNSYSGSTSFVYAYQEFTLDSGGYAISYDWRCNGEGNYDYLRVFLAPSTVTLPAGASPNSTTTSSYTWGSETLPSGCISLTGSSMKLNQQSSWQNVLSEIYVPTSGTWRLVFAWANDASVYNDPAGAIDNIVFMQPTCPRPSDMVFSNINTTSFDVSWTETGSATQWMVMVDSAGVTVDSMWAYDTTASFLGRAANTLYTVRVASLCDGMDTSMWLSNSFRTPCTFLDSLPFFYNFEDAATGTTAAFPYCWNRLNNGSSYNYYPYVGSSSSYNHTPGGSKGLYWYNTTTTGTYGDYEVVVLPGVDTDYYPIRNLQLRFWATPSSTGYSPILYVGVMTNPSDITTFQYVDTIQVSGSTNWQEYESLLSAYRGEGKFVAIRANRASWTLYVDDITLEEIPACPRTSELSQTDATLNSVTIDWTEMGEATQWVLQYDTVDFVPGTSAGTTEYPTSKPYTILGLDSAHSYYIYLHADCGGDTSDNRFILASTLAASPATTPFYCDFECEGTCGWELLNGNQTNKWHIGSAVNNGGSKSLYISNNGGVTNAYTNSTISYAYAYRTIDFADSGEFAYTYDWRSQGESHNYDFTRVFLTPAGYQWEANNNPAGNTYNFASWSCPSDWIELTEQFGSPANLQGSSAWRTASGTFRINSPATYNLVFAWANDGSGGSNPPTAIDNVAIVQNTCPAPIATVSHVTSDSIILVWTPGGNETVWVLSSDSMEVVLTDTFYVFDNLLPNTEYHFSVRALCDGGDTSMIASVNTRTACGPMVVPFHEGFESFSTSTADPLPNCWYKNTNYSTSYPYASTSYNHTPGGGRAMYMYSSNSSWSYMVLPLFAPALDSLQVSFWLYKSNTSYAHRLEVGIITNPTDPTSFYRVQNVVPTLSSTWEEIIVPLHNDSVHSGYICIKSPDGEYSYPYLDDLTVEYLPTCPKPVNISLLTSSLDTVSIAWSDTSSSTNFQVVYGNNGFNPDTATVNIIDVNDSTYDFTTLSPSIIYDIYVRTDCGADGYSSWTGPVTVSPGSYNMAATGVDTLVACNITIFDDGGPMGQYTNSANSTLVILAPHPDSLFSFTGHAYTESSLDQLTIYDGVGTGGTMLWRTSSSTVSESIPVTRSNSGAITLSWHTDGSVVYDGFELNIQCQSAPNCNSISELNVSHVAGTSALLEWEVSSGNTGGDPAYYYVTVNGVTDTTTQNPYWITGLTPGTHYYVTVQGVCATEGTSFSLTADFATKCLIGGDVEISGGTGSNVYYPLNASVNYSYTQEIYAASQLSGPMNISGVAYHIQSSGCSTRNISLYLGEVTQSSITSVSNYIPLSQLHLVYTGSFSGAANTWSNIYFDSTFSYTGLGNLVVALDDNTGYTGTANFYTSSGTDRAIHFHNSTDINPASPSGTTQLNTGVQNDIRFLAVCDTTATCAPPNVAVFYTTPYEAFVSWAPGLNETSWTVSHRANGSATWTTDTVGIGTTTYLVTGLLPNTEYTFRVTGICTDTTLDGYESARTDCAPTTALPIIETFESAPTGTSTTGSPFVNCWARLNNGTSYGGYPYVSSSSSYNHTPGGNKGLYWYNTTTTGTYGDYQIVVMPEVDSTIDISNLQLTFFAKPSSSSYVPVFHIGVMSDPNVVSSFVSLDTVTLSGTDWTEVEIPLNTYTGSGRFVAVRAVRPSSSWYAYVDDFTLDYIPTCVSPRNVFASDATSTSITLDWVDITPAMEWQIEYGPQGFTRGSSAGTSLSAYTHPILITGLDTLTNYDFYVRPICSVGDTARWRYPTTLTTAMCDNSDIFAIGSPSSSSTTYYAPVNNYYNYTLTETIIDSAEIGGAMDFEYIGYYYDYSSPSTVKTNCTIYFQPTTLSTFSSTSSMVALDTSTAVKVYTGSLNCSQGWNFFPLDTVYHYDGNSNLLIIVDDNSYDYDGSSYVFRAEPCSGTKTIHYYSDSENPSVTNPSSFSGNMSTASWRPVMQLVSCMAAGCRQPVITSVTKDYHSATVTWAGEGNNYEVNIKESTATDWPATDIAVTGNSYTFNGLMPATNYTFRVRQDCTADSLDYSEWAIGGVLTDSLPCLTPDSLHATAVTNATATLDWNVNGNENVWDIHVWYGSFDSIYRTILRPATVGGFTAGITYNAAIRAVCGVNLLEGDWSDTVQFTTAVCPDITGLSTSNVTTNSVTLNWNSNPMALRWNIEYGPTGFTQGQGTQAVSNTNSYVVTGLSDGITYDFYVKAVCGDDWTSENWVGTSATTQEGTIPCDAPTGVSTAVADNSVTVNWTAGTGNISFELEYGPRGFSHGAGSTTTATSSPAVIANLDYETQYDVYVRAVCEQNIFSPWSTVSTFTTGERPSEDCDPVQNLTVTNVTETSADISWQPGPTGDHWQVVLTDGTGSTISDNVTAERQATFSNLTPGTNYTVKVRTDCGDGNYSAYVTANFRTLGGEGIEDVDGISCRIFPNPATSSTTISVTGVNGMVRIAVVDMNGRTVATETLECSADCEKTMEVDKLAQGAYFVRITADNTNMVKKLIVR